LGGAGAEPRDPGLGRRAGRRTPCARESCDCSQQSRAFGCLVGGDDGLLGGASAEPGQWAGSGKRQRASAFQGLRRAGSGVWLCAGLQGALRNRRREECGLNIDPEPAKVQAIKVDESAHASINSTRSGTTLSRSGFVQ
jgi:hypothetical protein